ncbi:AraC family transcriptional regulator [Paenibacillaceae bacterium]|nr:AraC family transcriptional regulator [Paenibacillaceae bacterium]
MSESQTKTSPYFPFEMMRERFDALDLLDFRFHWGNYRFRVLHCHLTSFAAGKIIRFHKHSEFEFHFIPRGEGSVILGDERFKLREGMFYLTGPGVLHQQEADARVAMDELCLHIDIEEQDNPGPVSEESEWEVREADNCVKALRTFPAVTFQDAHHAMPWFLTAYRTLLEGQPGFYTTIKQAIIQILLRSVRVNGSNTPGLKLPAHNVSDHRYRMAVHYIQDNYASPITLQEVAERLQISSRQLQRIFKEQKAGSFSTYVENYRLAKICEALLGEYQSIEQIAAEHGFSGSNYLYYVFKKKIGMTPSQYKQQKLSER